MSKPLDNLKTLNRTTIAELVGDEPDKIIKFQSEFLIQSHKILKQIIQSFNSSDFSGLKSHAHYLKTSAKAVGAERSAFYLETIESHCLEGNKAAMKQVIIKLNCEFKAIKEVLTDGK